MSDSVLDARFTLRDLLDLGVLGEVLEAYSQCFQLRITILNHEGEEVLVTLPEMDFCKAIQGTSMREKCDEIKDRLYKYPLEGPSVLQNKSFCGMRYAIFPLTYQLDSLGRVIIGPFQDPDLSSDQILSKHGESTVTIDQLQEIPSFSREQLKIVLKLLNKIVNSFLFINAKRLITTKLHLENIYSSRESIFRQVELQDSGSKKDKEEIKKLKNMF